MSPPHNVSILSDIEQLDGNITIQSDQDKEQNLTLSTQAPCDGIGLNTNDKSNKVLNKHRTKNALVATHLPVVTVCNMRSFFPKVENFKLDFFEHQVEASLLCEVWHKIEDKRHKLEIEKMLEMDGLKYFSTTRPRGKRGGGAAVIVNTVKFKAEKLDVQVPPKLEVIWVLAKPKSQDAKIKRIVLCSFYSPPRSKMRDKLKDHIIGTLQMLTTKYPGCGILVGGDKNKMNISPLLNNNLNLRQIVTRPTRKQEVLDVLLTNLFPFYNTPIIIPPVQPDVPGQGVPSDHSVPLCIPNRDPTNPPERHYRTVICRPLPESKVRDFGQWMIRETWGNIKNEEEPNIQVNVFQSIIAEKLDMYPPQKCVKLGIEDKPFMTSELKSLKRNREYRANGKSGKYTKLKQEFETKFIKDSGDF